MTSGSVPGHLAAPARTRASLEARLRVFDVALALVALLLLAPLMLLAGMLGHTRRVATVGRHGKTFERIVLVLPATRAGRWLARASAHRGPDLWHVLQGHLAWVGPRARPVGAADADPAPSVRPGLVSSWVLRRRAAIDFDGEAGADADDLRQRGVVRHLGLVGRALLMSLTPAPAAVRGHALQVVDVRLDNIDMGEALSRIGQMLEGDSCQLVCFANPACVNIAARHRGYRRALRRAALVLPDGFGLKLAGDLLGMPLRQNVNGTDLYPRLLQLLDEREARVFLLGGRDGVPQKVAALIGRTWPQVRVVGVRHGYFDSREEADVISQINASGADVLLVARGVPSQELFVDRHAHALGVRVAVGVGGLFDFASGRIPRAPQWLREMGMEWVYRLIQEPGRMWRRYLVGNFTFLARVLLQRFGLRTPQLDEAPKASTPADASPVRAVLFATTAAPDDVPVPASYPAALLPMGPSTVIERQVEALARAQVNDIAIVMCDAPEQLRARLGDGGRWGVRISWHVVKDPARPYAMLRSPSFATASRILIGHADCWLDEQVLRRLSGRDEVAVQRDEWGHPRWTGWVSGPVSLLADWPVDGDRRDVESRLLSASSRLLTVWGTEGVSMRTASDLLQHQLAASGGLSFGSVPASWIRHPWGCASPLARVHPQARLTGPVLIGPGCVVEAGADVGPQSWLCEDVILSTGSIVRQSVVLPGTYVAPGLELDGMVVNGARVRHLRHGVEMDLPEADGLLSSLHQATRRRPGPVGRALAALAGMALAPAGGLGLAYELMRRRRAPWVAEGAVRTVRDGAAPGEGVVTLIGVRPGAGAVGAAVARWVQLWDVVAGRRTWFGVRARSRAQWVGLHPEWQRVLGCMPIGLLHEPAWTDAEASGVEAEAVADVYHATHGGWQGHLGLLARLVGRLVARRVARALRPSTLPARTAGPAARKVPA